jgi:hypothetical protein
MFVLLAWSNLNLFQTAHPANTKKTGHLSFRVGRKVAGFRNLLSVLLVYHHTPTALRRPVPPRGERAVIIIIAIGAVRLMTHLFTLL